MSSEHQKKQAMFYTFPRAVVQLYQAPVNVDKAKILLFLEKHIIFKFNFSMLTLKMCYEYNT